MRQRLYIRFQSWGRLAATGCKEEKPRADRHISSYSGFGKRRTEIYPFCAQREKSSIPSDRSDRLSWSRVLCCFQHGQDVPRWILKPVDCWPIPSRNSTRVGLHVGFVVDFKSHTALAQFLHSFLHAFHGKVQDRESCRPALGFWIHHGFVAARQGHSQGAFRAARNFKPSVLP